MIRDEMPEQETTGEQYEDNQEFIEDQDTQEVSGDAEGEFVETQEGESQERVDWKARAIEAETRATEYQRWLEQQQSSAQQAQAAPSEPNRVDALQAEIRELEATVPKVDPQNPDTFWANQDAKDALNQKRFELQEARIEAQQHNQLRMQAQTTVQSYKSRFRQNPSFAAVEEKFDSMVSQLAPQLQTNQAMLDMIRKNVEYDYYMQQNNNQTPQQQQQRQARKVPQAPSGAYNQQQAPKPKGVKFKNDQDAQVAEWYRMNPDEFYTEPASPHAQGNGIQIYDVPESPRRFGKG